MISDGNAQESNDVIEMQDCNDVMESNNVIGMKRSKLLLLLCNLFCSKHNYTLSLPLQNTQCRCKSHALNTLTPVHIPSKVATLRSQMQ